MRLPHWVIGCVLMCSGCCCCCCCRRCDWLDKKNTIFGKIVGDTVYNMLRLNELEVRARTRG